MKTIFLFTLFLSISAQALQARLTSIDSIHIQDDLGSGKAFSVLFRAGDKSVLVTNYQSPEFLLNHCIALGQQMMASPEKYKSFVISGAGKTAIEFLSNCSLTRK